ncbi:hypothetical protein RS030_6907 [Cryptosporidium xiaoi]|uniref:SAM-dependent MTase RsmB/NOP-type domain-containing protein n=1 Tax=Cryptosporidium xiaoi TaxID=659607 RepID=A0AAV9XU26_9CRYT
MEKIVDTGASGVGTKRLRTNKDMNLCINRGGFENGLGSEAKGPGSGESDKKEEKLVYLDTKSNNYLEGNTDLIVDYGNGLSDRRVSLFEWYYRSQGICNSESEYNELFEAIRRPLPISFRTNMSHQQVKLLIYVMENSILTANGREEQLSMLKFRKDKLSKECIFYNIYDLSRSEMKKEPGCDKLREFIKSQDIFGTISSQECVSMLPSAVLDINSTNLRVLDLCSAPGSKSMNILDYMNVNTKQENEEKARLGAKMCNGIVVMNDVCPRRINTLITRINRMPSPSAIVTCIDATFMPNLLNKRNKECFKFDRILADVPCSSDGTMRKNGDILKNWKLEKALHLHKKQLSILSRAYRLLDEYGKLVYSTCSLNPIENEAVISALLQKYDDAVLFPPVNIINSNFNLSTGLDDWLVYCSPSCGPLNNSYNQNFQNNDAQDRNCCHSNKYISPSMFPNKEWKEKKHYEKCVRVLPHKNNTGGFFFAIISKKPNGNDKKGNETHLNSNIDENRIYKYEDVEDSVWVDISDFFGLNVNCDVELDCLSEFPEEIRKFLASNRNHINNEILSKNNLVLKKGSKNSIYLINSGVSELLRNHNMPVNLKSIGVKCFENLKGSISGNSDFNWRITQSSAPYLIRFMNKRLLFASLDLLNCIKDNNIKGEETKKLANDSKLIGISSLCTKNERIEGGCILVVIVPPNVIKYSGTLNVNPEFNELNQSIILSAVLYSDLGINIFVPNSYLSSIKQLLFV